MGARHGYPLQIQYMLPVQPSGLQPNALAVLQNAVSVASTECLRRAIDSKLVVGQPPSRVPPILVRSLPVRWSIPMRGGIKARRLLGRRGVSGFLSSIGPVAVGVILAFAWNMATTQQQEVAAGGSGITPEIGVAVDQAAAQAWASVTPDTAAAGSARSPHGAAPSSRGQSHRQGGPAGGGCSQVNSAAALTAPRSVIATWRPGPPRDATVRVVASRDPRNTRRAGPVRVGGSVCHPQPRLRTAPQMQPSAFASIATPPAHTDAVTLVRPVKARPKRS